MFSEEVFQVVEMCRREEERNCHTTRLQTHRKGVGKGWERETEREREIGNIPGRAKGTKRAWSDRQGDMIGERKGIMKGLRTVYPLFICYCMYLRGLSSQTTCC